MRPFAYLLLILSLLAVSCGPGKAVEPDALRGLSKEDLEAMRMEILSRHADGSSLSSRETADVELIREQERRLENAWIFGQWQERHGARLIFRDDGTVSVGARAGVYDELGVYKYVSPEVPAFEAVWTLVYDAEGNPVVLVDKAEGTCLVYRFHKSRNSVREEAGDLQASSETGCLFVKSI